MNISSLSFKGKTLEIKFRENILEDHLNDDAWTPAFGAQLLCGFEPFNDNEFSIASHIFSDPEVAEARRILRLWIKDKKNTESVSPFEFMRWAESQNSNLEWLKSPERDKFIQPFDYEGKSMAEKFKQWINPPINIFVNESQKSTQNFIPNADQKSKSVKSKKISQSKFSKVYTFVLCNIVKDENNPDVDEIWEYLINTAAKEHPPHPIIGLGGDGTIKCYSFHEKPCDFSKGDLVKFVGRLLT